MLRLTVCLFMFSTLPAADPVPPANYDESKIVPFTLPDPLVCADGSKVTSPELWQLKRRPELWTLFADQMFGHVPASASQLEVKVGAIREGEALDGKALRREVDLVVNWPHAQDKSRHLTLRLLLYIPKQGKGPFPAFLGLNFNGNQAVNLDPGITITPSWVRDNKTEGVVNNQANEKSRGTEASRWQAELVIERGYALGTMYYGDIDPDFDDGFKNGIHPFAAPNGEGVPQPQEWGSIAAWAWGLSRALDYLETAPEIDAQHVAVIGHSRLGKTSLWAGATDERFAMVISNNSGCGGAALSKRVIGESVHRINTAFPHWFCDNFNQYNSNEAKLPFDQHELIALIAPRPVYVASAVEDTWADPKGEYLSCYYADPVYRLLGTSGLGGTAAEDASPEVDQPRNNGQIGYHIRTGKHDVVRYDWEQYLDFADRHFGKRK